MKKLLKKVLLAILWFQAKLVLKIKKPHIVAVTGNVGKTSAKDAIFAVLSGSLKCRKSKKSFNSEIGVPLTILGMPNGWNNPFIWIWNILRGFLAPFAPDYPDWLVLEVGADRLGDIEAVSKIVRPDIAVYTKVGEVPVHIEYFASRDELIREKSFLAERTKEGGVVILNADDVYTNEKLAEYVKGKKTLSYGFGENADIRISEYAILFETISRRKTPVGISFILSHKDERAVITLRGILGRQYAYPVASAVAVLSCLGRNITEAEKCFENYKAQPGRMNIVRGIKNSVIIDDSYNSSPVALDEALNSLKDMKIKRRKIAVLGDMLELGKHSSEAHQSAGKKTAETADILCTVGFRGRGFAEGALAFGMPEDRVFQFENSREAGAFIQNMLREGDVVLVKGSQGARMEKVVEEIMAEPEKAGELLVRQEEEWKRR